MEPTAIVQIVQDVWDQYLPVILPVAGIVVSAGVAIYLALRFVPAIAVRLFRGGN